MRSLLLSFSVLTVLTATAQNPTVYITVPEYQQLKSAGELNTSSNYVFTDVQHPQNVFYNGVSDKSGVCNCLVTMDSTYQLAMLPNDDESSANIPIPFSFDFYGTSYDSLYINNNGNISFLAPYVTFTANPFPDAMYNMIAPFWGDVDTRAGGEVWYKVTPTAMIVVWSNVGYFAEHNDLVSTFQLIITDGNDPLIPGGNNVSFCYGDMQWTTGDASGGIGGFGGSAATVGVNIGNGVDFFQVGQFDNAGTAFDGPYGANDQISFLDQQEIYFNIAGAGTNTPPLLVNSMICDTIDVYTGDTLAKSTENIVEFTLTASTPEAGQTLVTSISCDEPLALTYEMNQVSAECVRFDCVFDPNGLSPGMYAVTLNATDNGIPAASSTQTVWFEVNYDASLSIKDLSANLFDLVPNPTNGDLFIRMNDSESNATVKIVDAAGAVYYSGAVTNAAIDLKELESGIYFAVVNTGIGNPAVKKIIKY